MRGAFRIYSLLLKIRLIKGRMIESSEKYKASPIPSSCKDSISREDRELGISPSEELGSAPDFHVNSNTQSPLFKVEDPFRLGNCYAWCYINHNPIFVLGPQCIL